MRSYADALAWAKRQVTAPTPPEGTWYNRCQQFSRLVFGAAVWAPSAREAFNATPAANRHTSWPPPPGSIAYWGNDHSGAGHATPILDTCYSNDIYRRGQIDKVKITTRADQMPFVTRWGLPYRGWIDATPSGPIPRPPVPVGRVVRLAELQPHDRVPSSTSALIMNDALIAEGLLPKASRRAYWSPAAHEAFRVFRNQGKYPDNLAAFQALGRRHDFTVA